MHESFFTTKAAGVGTGLGLSTAHGFIVQSGGTLEIDSSPGIGTCVTVSLPRLAGPASEEALRRAGAELLGARSTDGGEVLVDETDSQ